MIGSFSTTCLDEIRLADSKTLTINLEFVGKIKTL